MIDPSVCRSLYLRHEPLTLSKLTADLLDQLEAHRRRAAACNFQAVEVVGNFRAFGDLQPRILSGEV